MMTHFDKYQNLSGFVCLMLISAIFIFAPPGMQNFNKKMKTNWIVEAVVS